MSKPTYYTLRCKTLTIAEWSRESGINHMTIRERIQAGWEPEAAIFTLVDRARHPKRVRGNEAWRALSDQSRGMAAYRRAR